VPKRPRAATSHGEPSPKKAKKGSEADAPTQMPEVIPSGAEEHQEDEEEEEGEATPILRPHRLRSTSPAILTKEEPAGESTMAEGVEWSKEEAEELGVENSMQTWIFPFFLVTGTILATQSRCCSSLIKLEFISFLTSDWIASIISGQNRRCCCLTGFVSELMLRRCIAT